MTIRYVIKKSIKYFVIGVASLYLIFVLGLSAINWLMKKSGGIEEGIQAHSKELHTISLFDSGLQSFYSRLELIKQAKKSIELEFFIFNLDEASRLLTSALIERAQNGVEVRILVDFSAPVFQLKPIYARYLKKHGIEVRYYNTKASYRLLSIQHRSHRKLLIIDGKDVITGGRNIGNEYFDLSKEYNFLDTDIYLHGPLVQEIQKSFNLYWQSSLSSLADDIDKELNSEELAIASSFFSPQEEDSRILQKVKEIGVKYSSKSYPCSDITYITDFPNQGESNRRVFQAIEKELSKAKLQVVAESPYFVIKQGGYDILMAASDRGVKLNFLTNGLYSTDATYSVAPLIFNLDWLAKLNMNLNVFSGEGVPGQTDDNFSRTKRWGIHSKRAVIDGVTVLVGTYNIDPRSANLNSELMVICRNSTELAKDISMNIEARIKESKVVIQNGEYSRWNVLFGSSFEQKVMLLLFLPVSNLFDFLL